jgi:hypothetical protein
MQGAAKKLWLELCVEAAVCDDAIRLRELEMETARLLKEEILRLQVRGPLRRA